MELLAAIGVLMWFLIVAVVVMSGDVDAQIVLLAVSTSAVLVAFLARARLEKK